MQSTGPGPGHPPAIATPDANERIVAPTPETEWDINLRGNLRLWPDPVANIAALVTQADQAYDEDDLLARFPSDGGKTPTDTRAVRNTFEVLAKAGLMYRDGRPEQLRLSPLGECVMAFLGTIGPKRFANIRNRRLLAEPLMNASSCIIECRVIWTLLLQCDGRLTNEELNRAMAAIHRLEQATEVARRIRAARAEGDPDLIGPRIYRPQEANTEYASDQRKAMNPHFLLAGGGGVFIDVQSTTDLRSLPDWAIEPLSRAVRRPMLLRHASTSKGSVMAMSTTAGIPAFPAGLLLSRAA
jgi:hypothetical protein